MAYSDKVIDHYETRATSAPLTARTTRRGHRHGRRPGLRRRDEAADPRQRQTGVIEDARFKTYGCGSAIASSSLVTEWVKGKTLDQALAIKNTAIAEELALPPVKIHCSILAEDAIKAAVADYRSRHDTSVGPTDAETTRLRPPRRTEAPDPRHPAEETPCPHANPKEAPPPPAAPCCRPAAFMPTLAEGAAALNISDSVVARWPRCSPKKATQPAAAHLVTGGGCSGFQYGFAFDDETKEDDVRVERGPSPWWSTR
jgi:nitrogen fixation NifU-like protein